MLVEIGAGLIPEILALNKWDLLPEVQRARLRRRVPDGVPVSALTGEGLDDLLRATAGTLPSPPVQVRLVIPFDRPEVLPRLYERAEVLTAEEGPGGMAVVARVSEAELAKVGEFVQRPATRRAQAPG